MANALQRQWELLRILARHQKFSAGDLHRRLDAQGYSASKRTVERDLIELSTLFPIESDERSVPYGWRWKPGAPVCEVPGLTTAEALAFLMIERHAQAFLPAGIKEELSAYFSAAEQRLRTDTGSAALNTWIQHVRSVPTSQPLQAPKTDPAVHATLSEALLHQRQIEITYCAARQSRPSPAQIVHPLGLVIHGLAMYLAVRFDAFSNIRILAVHRIKSAKCLPGAIQPPPDFDLDEYIASGAFGFGEIGHLIDLEAVFHGNAGRHLSDTPLTANQELKHESDGSLRLKARLPLTLYLRRWLLGFGADVEVLAPEGVRQELRENLRRALDRYRPSEDASAQSA